MFQLIHYIARYYSMSSMIWLITQDHGLELEVKGT